MLGPRVRCIYCGDVIRSERDDGDRSCTCGRISVRWQDSDYHIDYPQEPPEQWMEIIADEGQSYFELGQLIGFIQDRLIELGYAACPEDIAAVLDAEKEFMITNGFAEDEEEEGQ